MTAAAQAPNWVDVAGFWIGVATALLLLGYTTVTLCQLLAMRRQFYESQRARLALVHTAYLRHDTLDGALKEHPIEGAPGRLAVRLVFRNVGLGAAVDLHEECDRSSMQDETTPPQPFTPYRGSGIAIGPQEEYVTEILFAAPEDQSNAKYWHFWSWLRYRDVFGKLHETRACVLLDDKEHPRRCGHHGAGIST